MCRFSQIAVLFSQSDIIAYLRHLGYKLLLNDYIYAIKQFLLDISCGYYTVGHKKTCHFYFFDNSGKY